MARLPFFFFVFFFVFFFFQNASSDVCYENQNIYPLKKENLDFTQIPEDVMTNWKAKSDFFRSYGLGFKKDVIPDFVMDKINADYENKYNSKVMGGLNVMDKKHLDITEIPDDVMTDMKAKKDFFRNYGLGFKKDFIPEFVMDKINTDYENKNKFMVGSNFMNKDMYNDKFMNKDMYDTKFMNKDMYDNKFMNKDMYDNKFMNRDMYDTKFMNKDMYVNKFMNKDMYDNKFMNMYDTKFMNKDMYNTKFMNKDMYDNKFMNMYNTKFMNKDMNDNKFMNKDMYDNKFMNRDMYDTKFMNKDMYDSKFMNKDMYDNKFMNRDMYNTKFMNTDMHDNKFMNKDMYDNKFMNRDMYDTTIMTGKDRFYHNIMNKDMYDTDMTHMYGNNMMNKDMYNNRDMYDTIFMNKDMYDNKFMNKDMYDNKFMNRDMYNTKFMNKDMYDNKFMNMYDNKFMNRDMYNTKFMNKDMYDNKFMNKDMYDNKFMNRDMYNTKFMNKDMYDNKFMNKDMYDNKFMNKDMYDNKFMNKDMYANKFMNQDMYDNKFMNRDMYDTKFMNKNMYDNKFMNKDMYDTTMMDKNLMYKNIMNKKMFDYDTTHKDMHDTNFMNTNMYNTMTPMHKTMTPMYNTMTPMYNNMYDTNRNMMTENMHNVYANNFMDKNMYQNVMDKNMFENNRNMMPKNMDTTMDRTMYTTKMMNLNEFDNKRDMVNGHVFDVDKDIHFRQTRSIMTLNKNDNTNSDVLLNTDMDNMDKTYKMNYFKDLAVVKTKSTCSCVCPSTVPEDDITDTDLMQEQIKKVITKLWSNKRMTNLTVLGKRLRNIILTLEHSDEQILQNHATAMSLFIFNYLSHVDLKMDMCSYAMVVNASIVFEKDHDMKKVMPTLDMFVKIFSDNMDILKTNTFQNLDCLSQDIKPKFIKHTCMGDGMVFDMEEFLDQHEDVVPLAFRRILLDLHRSTEYVDRMMAVLSAFCMTPQFVEITDNWNKHMTYEMVSMMNVKTMPSCCCDMMVHRFDKLVTLVPKAVSMKITAIKEKMSL